MWTWLAPPAGFVTALAFFVKHPALGWRLASAVVMVGSVIQFVGLVRHRGAGTAEPAGRALAPGERIWLGGDERWEISPGRGEQIEQAVEVAGRRFVATVHYDEAERLTAAGVPRPPHPGTFVDVRAEFVRVLGRDPFREVPARRMS